MSFNILLGAAESARLDVWVLRVSIAIALLFLAGLVLWHLMGKLTGPLFKSRRKARLSPEPARPEQDRAVRDTGQSDPEKLERTCAALTLSLADAYLQLAECWTRRGQPQQATAALQKLIQCCPQTPQAQAATERLQQITTGSWQLKGWQQPNTEG